VDESRSPGAVASFAPRVISIVTVHGLWMRGTSMAVLHRKLAGRGFHFQHFNYRSVTRSLRDSADELAAYVERVPGETVHLIGHSLGGVLICAMLERSIPARTGRVVCLGSPLRGSRTAARLARWPGGRHVIGRCLADVHARNGFSAWRAGVEVGSIAGRIPLGVGRLFGPFAEPNDGTVAVAETKIDGLTDHIVLPVSHVALLWSAQVAAQVGHFLEHGRFRHELRT
jgi:pimeloyl-ACP methyl ester carboxylesterase